MFYIMMYRNLFLLRYNLSTWKNSYVKTSNSFLSIKVFQISFILSKQTSLFFHPSNFNSSVFPSFLFRSDKIPLNYITLLQIYPRHWLFLQHRMNDTHTHFFSLFVWYSCSPPCVQKWLRQEIYTTWIKSE